MTDVVDRATRSRMMRGIKGAHTAPERTVRSHLHRAGLRFTLHDPGLPGRPDLVLPRWEAVVFVHGCFWHRHANCRYATSPSSNRGFWKAKFEANVARDARKSRELRARGWRVFTVWECQVNTKRLDLLVRRIRG